VHRSVRPQPLGQISPVREVPGQVGGPVEETTITRRQRDTRQVRLVTYQLRARPPPHPYESALRAPLLRPRQAAANRASAKDSLVGMFVTGFVNLYTGDIEAGLHFYRDLLGFAETFRTPTEGTPEHVELTLNGFALGLGTVEAAKRAHGVDAAPGSPAMALVVWTEDVDKAFAQLVSAGTPVVQPPHNTSNNNRNALLHDPDGNLVEVVSKAT